MEDSAWFIVGGLVVVQIALFFAVAYVIGWRP
jgi:hypothetical protein